MKKTTMAKIIFDVALTVIMLLIMAYSLTGGMVHEVMGLVALGLFLLHKLFNGKWIVRVTKKVFMGGCDGLNAVKYVVDIIFLILMIVAGGSGILISNHVLTGVTVFDRTTWIYIHRVASYSSLIVMSVHIGLHWELIMAAFRNMLGLNKNCKPRKIVLRILAFIMALLGIRANVDKDFLSKFTPDKNDTETETTDSIDKTGVNYNVDDDDEDENGQTVVGNNASYTSKTALFIEQTRGGTAEYDFSANPHTSSESEQEYLGRINCTGCGRQCLLTNPQCNTGSQLASQGSAYYQSYSKSADTTITTTQPQTEAETQTETQTEADTDTVTSQAQTDEQSSLADDSTEDKAVNNEKTDSSYSSSDSETDSTTSLDEYLGKLYCSGCGRHCSLLSPQCDKGASQAQQATADYNNTYQTGTSSTNEVIFDDDAMDSLKNLFGTMIPVMCLYVCGTYYIVKFAKRH